MNEMTHTQFLSEAVRLAVENVEKGIGGPFAALVVKDGKVVGTGTNQVTLKNDPTAHAEVMAIRDACQKLGTFQLDGCILYTSCEPCPMCLGAIYWARPEAVYYACTKDDAAKVGFDDAFIYKEIPISPEKRSIPMYQLKVEDAFQPMALWEKTADKIEY